MAMHPCSTGWPGHTLLCLVVAALRQVILWVQVLRGLHAEGRAHGDLKFANIRVRLGEELSTHFQDLMLVDVGCSSTYKGGWVPLCKWV